MTTQKTKNTTKNEKTTDTRLTEVPPANTNHPRRYEKTPMTIGQRVTISERCEEILAGIYQLPLGASYKVSEILSGPQDKYLFELTGNTSKGAPVTFVVSPKMVRRIRITPSTPVHVTAEKLAQDFHRPQVEFKGLAALAAAGKIRRTTHGQGQA
jgi:hypothetical protein